MDGSELRAALAALAVARAEVDAATELVAEALASVEYEQTMALWLASKPSTPGLVADVVPVEWVRAYGPRSTEEE